MGAAVSYGVSTGNWMIHTLTKDPDEEWNHVVYKWPLLSSPIPTLLICMTFSYLAKVYGPFYMKNREPFKIKGLVIAYNLAMVAINLYMFVMFGQLGWWNGYSFKCQPMDRTLKSLAMYQLCYLYMLTRFLDFVDTLFFVMTKKFSHITYLHLIHHSIMPFCSYIGMRIGPSGHPTLGTMINCLVHVIMYGYYFLTCLGPKVKPYLWWKKYLTAIQLAQFAFIKVHMLQIILRPNCDYPKESVAIMIIVMSLFTVLFANFYIHSYVKRTQFKRSKSRLLEEEEDSNNNIKLKGM